MALALSETAADNDHMRQAAVRASAQAVRPSYVTALLICFAAAAIQNFLGILVVILFALQAGIVKKGKLHLNFLAGAFLVIALAVAARAALPSQMSLAVQSQEAVRYLAFGLFAASLSKVRPAELIAALSIWISLNILTYPIYVFTGLFATLDATEVIRFSGLLPHANHLGYVAGSVLIGFLYLQFSGRMQIRYLLAICLMSVFILVATRSSGSLLYVAVGVGALAIAVKPSARTIAIVVLAGILVTGLLLSPIGQQAIDKLLNFDFRTVLVKSQNYNFGNQGSSFAWRLSYWIALIEANINSGPFYTIFGQGGGSTGLNNRIFSFMRHDPHSDYVRIFFEIGLSGFIVTYAALIWACAKSRATVISYAIIFLPMLSSNTIANSSVMFVIIVLFWALHSSGFFDATKKNIPFNATAGRDRQYRPAV